MLSLRESAYHGTNTIHNGLTTLGIPMPYLLHEAPPTAKELLKKIGSPHDDELSGLKSQSLRAVELTERTFKVVGLQPAETIS
jgi:hypothetical protein